MPQLWIIAGLLVAAWIVQLVLAYRQAIEFAHRIAQMRRAGTVSVGLGRGRLRSRVYAVVAVARDGRVVAADVLRGWSSLSKPRAIPGLSGLPFERLCETAAVADLDKPLRDALCQVVSTLREDRAARRSEGGVTIAQHA
ncbi:MAG: transcriptional regulator GutM [Candidatus Dormibacteria bacterium]